MTPIQTGQEWFVYSNSGQVAGPFKTNGEAWRWIDRQEGQPVSRAENVSQWVFEQMAKGNGL